MTNFEKFIVFLNLGALIVNTIRSTLAISQGNSFWVPLIAAVLNVVAIILFIAPTKSSKKTETNTQ